MASGEIQVSAQFRLIPPCGIERKYTLVETKVRRKAINIM